MLHPMTPVQCRAARALLHLNQSELATLSGLGLSTVVDFERERRPVSQEAIALLQNALERAGILFREGGVELALLAGLSAPTGPFGENYTHLAEESPWRWLSGAQIRAGRALLRWSAADLARATALGVNTIRRAELAEAQTPLTAANELAIRRALETAGVVFIEENGGGPGVRLRERQSAKSRAK
jgi:transcriptional regulator with XRE-family HTH domain